LKRGIKNQVPDPVSSRVTHWSREEYSRGVYSYIAVGSSGEDYDTMSRPVEDILFFAGEATNRQHPSTIAGAFQSGLREAGRIDRLMCKIPDEILYKVCFTSCPRGI
jgi:lysine-specific histone demethylase 1